MNRRPTLWHLDESHEHSLDTVRKSKRSRWFVGTSPEITPTTPSIDSAAIRSNSAGSGNTTQEELDDSARCDDSVHSEQSDIRSTASLSPSSPATSAVATRESDLTASTERMDSPASSPSLSENRLVRRSSQERQRLLQMISDFNVHRQGRLGEIEIRDGEEGEIIFEGVLRVYWGVKKPIFLSSEKIEDLSPQRRRRSKNILAADLKKMSGGKRTWSQSAGARRRIGTGGAPALGRSETVEEQEAAAAQPRARSLPDATSVLGDDAAPMSQAAAADGKHRRRATVGTATVVAMSSKGQPSRLTPTPENTELEVSKRHQTVSAGTPPTARVAITLGSTGNGTAEENAASAKVEFRRSSEPMLPKETELASTARKAKVQRSVSTQEGKWQVLVDRVNRRAKRTSYHAAVEDKNASVLDPFIPPRGSMSNVCIDSEATTVEVIRALLRKVNAIDEPARFAVFAVKDNGEVKRLRDDESPLYRRLHLGPKEDLAKLWIMEARDTDSVSLSADVAQFYNMSMPFLQTLVERYQEEEDRAEEKIRERFLSERECLIEMIEEMEALDNGIGSLV
ncbi:uncharacterized protein LOC135810648 [Sycon ciliatum]|uniref:uncharacterized protein LOC135810648 n=1 Tax=Sycon ciliatum TaxID=27933 RepID=UPI0031F65F4D